MDNNKNKLACLLAAALLLAVPAAYADITVDKIADVSFGTIDFSSPTGSGNITMGTDGNISYGSNTSGAGVGTPGQILLGGTVGTTVTIACAPGTLAPATGTALPIDPVNFVVGAANVGTYAVGTACTDLATSVATHTITGTPSENTIFIGGQLTVSGLPLTTTTYRGSNLNGTQPAFRVLVQ